MTKKRTGTSNQGRVVGTSSNKKTRALNVPLFHRRAATGAYGILRRADHAFICVTKQPLGGGRRQGNGSNRRSQSWLYSWVYGQNDGLTRLL